MGRPIAYEYHGFLHNGKSYPVWSDDEDPNQFYVMPNEVIVATDSAGKPKSNFAVCQAYPPPIIKGLANMVPYLNDNLISALKKEYGERIAPLPVASGGQVMITAADAAVQGLAVENPWRTDNLSQEGLSEEKKLKLNEAKRWYEEHNVRAPLTFLTAGNGIAIQVPNIVGSNIGAEIPLSMVVEGARNVATTKALLDSGAVLNGQIIYHYIGTVRPWALQITADLSKVHSWLSEHFSVGYWFAKADIYNALEKMHQESIITFDVWDENDQITGKYKPEQIFDKFLDAIVKKIFNFHPNMKPNKAEAKAEGKRHWWWHGAYQRKSSSVEVSEIINVKIRIHGKSEPIPVSTGIYVSVPDYTVCNDVLLVEAARTKLIGEILDADDEKVLNAVSNLAPSWIEKTRASIAASSTE